MSTCEIIALAKAIVKAKNEGSRIKAPRLKGWELSELIFWMKNLETDLI